MKNLFYLFVACFMLMSCTRQVLAPLEPDDEFERAMSFFDKKKYASAAQSFERIIFYHPSSEYVDDAQYWLARTYFAEKDYAQSIIEFEYLINNFSNSEFSEDAYLYRAKSYLFDTPSYDRDQTKLNQAINLFDDFLTRFPNSQHSNEVKELILTGRNRLAQKEVVNGKLYIKLNKPEAALIYFNYVVETYPETKAASEAKYCTAQLYEKKGGSEEALNLYKELLGDNDWQKKAEERIAEIEKKQAQEK